ncbi:hypothetical protein TELCIR_11348 [Teladorsagia circumcincta]|uniref:Uncharacterized protein n=1 Tax=Teladorsagia circumcincta TaxID=45464 RepID=A0A2G9UBR0_TELCI|nr:hypothetical protein TELCIR_11348 [Teladorsagia circumcincta]
MKTLRLHDDAEQDACMEDFSELQPVASQYLTFLMDYNADFACDVYTPAPTTTYECFANSDCAGSVDPLEDLRDLSLDAFANLFDNGGNPSSPEPWS